jgi:hypothetical protein
MNDWRLDRRKILDYLLSDTSASGAAKNRFFGSFGFRPHRWEGIDTTSTYGTKYVYRCRIITPDARNPCILTVWQHREGDYWLVTAYPFD